MTRGWFVDDVPAALRERRFPTVTVWNRVEPRPRSADFSRALRAEVRDALWMLTRQWQLGEFRGDDAGTPVSVRYHLATTRPTRFAPGGDPADTVPVDPTLPLEAAVESRPPAFRIGDDLAALDLRLLMGRQWLRLVPAAARPAFLATYGIAPPDPADEDDVELVSHPEVWATLQAVAGRAMDGYRLWEHLRADPGHHAYDGTGLPAALHPAVDAAADRFLRWFTDLITVTDGTSWVPERARRSASGHPLPADLVRRGERRGGEEIRILPVGLGEPWPTAVPLPDIWLLYADELLMNGSGRPSAHARRRTGRSTRQLLRDLLQAGPVREDVARTRSATTKIAAGRKTDACCVRSSGGGQPLRTWWRLARGSWQPRRPGAPQR